MNRRLAKWSAGGVLAVAILLINALVATAPAHAENESVLLSGKVEGASPSAAQMSLSAYGYSPTAEEGTISRGRLLAQGYIRADGTFALSMRDSDLRTSMNQTGDVLVQLRAESASGQVNHPLNLRLSPQQTWLNADPNASLTNVTLAITADQRPATRGPTFAAQTCTGGYGWGMTPNKQFSFVPLQAYKTLSKTNFLYSWDTTSTTRMESVSGTKGGSLYASGTLAYSSLNTAAAGIDHTWTYNTNQMLYVEWEYREWREYCFVINNLTVETGHIEWRPHRFAGGTSLANTSQDFTCTAANISTVAVTTWASRNAATAWGNLFSVLGIKLDVAVTNSESNKLTIRPRAGVTARACGSNQKPFYASRVKEIP